MYNDISLDTNDEEYNYLDETHQSIDQNDLIIIHNPLTWVPPDEIVIAYAKNLGLDILNDPPELFNIVKKYLLMPLAGNLIRCFRKDNYQIYYLNPDTVELTLENEIDIDCKNEYEKKKKKLKEEKKEKKKKKKQKIKIEIT